MRANDLTGRVNRWAHRFPVRIGDVPLTVLVLRIGQRFLGVRVMGLAAEMTYYAILSVFPLLGALGASLGFLERFIGPGAAEEVEATVLRWLDTVFSADVTAGVVAPMVQGLLQQERAGFAVGGFVVSLFLASRIFRSAIDTLDLTYGVEERRGTVAVWTLGFLFALGAIVTASTVLTMVVVGPLLGGGRAIADWFGLGTVFETVWTLLQWPTVFLVATVFLSILYRAGPNVRNTWRQSLPGAIVGMLLLILVAIGFRTYIGFTGLDSPEIRDAEEAVAVGAQVIGVVLAVLLWLWLSAVAILTGGVVNAELSRVRNERLVPQV